MTRASLRTKAGRRIAHRLETAQRLVREAAELVAEAVPPSEVERDRAALLELAGLLAELGGAYAPASRWPQIPAPTAHPGPGKDEGRGVIPPSA